MDNHTQIMLKAIYNFLLNIQKEQYLRKSIFKKSSSRNFEQRTILPWLCENYTNK